MNDDGRVRGLLLRSEIDDGLGTGQAASFVLPSGTITFLLTDVEGSTATWEAAPEAMAKAIDRHYEVLADVIGRHHGVRPVEQGEGDSVVAAFSRAADAVAAALEAQTRLGSEPWPAGARLSVRMALHTGDAQLRDAFNYFGPVVIRCARLRALAHGGQVLATGAVHDVVGTGLPADASWRDLGEHRLKDLAQPERVFQLCHPSVLDEFPPLRGINATPNNLPAQVSSFIGRQRELAAIAALLDDHRLLTLTGTGGSGKTRLALQASADRVDRHPDGIWYVELAAVAEVGSVADQVAAAVGVPEDPDTDLVDGVADHIGADAVLLVLDNCEHLLDGVAPVVATLLRRCPGLAVLATSRQQLDVPGEVSWRVPSMALPEVTAALPLDRISACDAVRLFADRAAQGRPDFGVDETNADTILRICRRLDGIPLAIELAAARVRQMGVADIDRGLEDRFRLLTGGGRTLLPRQQTLAASVDWSHDLLEGTEQVAFRRLAVFAGPFTAQAAAAVLDDPDAADILGGLVDRSLLQLDDQPGGTRYRYLETVKAYARERLRAAEETDATSERHLRHHIELAEQAEPSIRASEDAHALRELDRSHDDLRTALRWAANTADVDAVLRLVVALGPYWHARGHGLTAQAWYEDAIRLGGDPVLTGRAAWASAYIALYANDLELAMERGGLALELAEGAGDDSTTARALDTLASIRQYGDPAGAEPDFHRALDLAERSGDRWCTTDALQKLGYSGVYRDRWDEAIAYGTRSRAAALELGNPFFLAWASFIVGDAALRTGAVETARSEMRDAVRFADEVGEPMTVGCTGTIAAMIEVLAGDDDAAEAAIAATVERLGDGDHGMADAMVAITQGVLVLQRGDAAAAAHVIGTVTAQLRQMGIAFPTSFFLPYLAEAHVAADDLDAAVAAIDDLEAIDAVLQSRHAPHAVALGRARVERAKGRPDLAEPHARAALAGFSGADFGPDAVLALESLAGVIGELGNHAESARLIAAADRTRRDHGWAGRTSAALHEQVAADVAAAREQLGDRFEGAWAEGASLDLAGAVALANRAHGTRDRPSTGWASLTPTELAVAEQVAVGRTNPEIAAELLMSRATVKTHVSHILTKLGLRNRAEVAVVAARQPSA
ncbi:MAG: regulatory protein LuxR [Acidimicrobiales bacterium]|nr:regulatory protein LuxR [Acidimicrobiales bacterium]